MSRRIVAVITIETDEAGRYYAHSDFCVAALSVGPWTTLLGCLDGLGRRLLDSMSFPRAQLAPSPVQDTTP